MTITESTQVLFIRVNGVVMVPNDLHRFPLATVHGDWFVESNLRPNEVNC